MLRKAKVQTKTKYPEHLHLALILHPAHNALLRLGEHLAHFQQQISHHLGHTMLGFDAPTKVGVKYTKVGYSPSNQNMFFPN